MWTSERCRRERRTTSWAPHGAGAAPLSVVVASFTRRRPRPWSATRGSGAGGGGSLVGVREQAEVGDGVAAMEPLLGDIVGTRGVSLPSEGAEPHALVPSSPLCLARRRPQPRWCRCPCAPVAAREGRKGVVREGSGLGGEGSGTQRPHELQPSLAL
jgi:hypothetical protein